MFHDRNKSDRSILHIDGDSFFASCEVAKNPALRGKPVVTGKERGIASSMTYEAKARGVSRAMSLRDILKICPDAIILPSDYETYSLYSKRMYEIVRRYTPEIEEYSIDECFADLTGMRRINNMSYQKMAECIKHDLPTGRAQSEHFVFRLRMAQMALFSFPMTLQYFNWSRIVHTFVYFPLKFVFN